MGEKMSTMRLVALALTVGISALVFGKPGFPNVPATGPSSVTRSVIYLSAGEKGSVWLAIGNMGRGLSRSGMYSRILLYRSSTGRGWERALDLVGDRSLERLWFFGSGRIIAWFHEPTRDVIFRTADGGNRWRSSILRFVAPPGFDGGHEADFISFLNPREGWMLVSEGVGMHQGHYVLYHTQDGGIHWKEIAQAIPWQSSPSGLGTELKTGIAFRDANWGWIGTNPITSRAYLYISRDGGATWEEQSLSPPAGAPDDFIRVMPPTFFGARSGVTVAQWAYTLFGYQTSDGGATWADPRPFPVAWGPDSPAWDILSPTHWAVASKSTLWLTSDGGRTWSEHPVPLPPTHRIYRIAYVDPSRIWLVGYQESPGGRWIADYVLETRDAGRHWTRVPLPQIP